MKLTKYGWPQVLIYPAAILAAILLWPLAGIQILPKWALWTIEIGLVIILLGILYFFRDPHRKIPPDKDILLSPADGKITDIELLENDYIGSTTIRIGIFLNIFDVHINRAPCNVEVLNTSYKKGSFKNAAKPAASHINESNDLLLVRTDEPKDKIIVRQISGAIAKRIVCKTAAGRNLTGGQKFGMIKFGSRTEILLPARSNIETLVKVGDKVKAGVTPLVKYIPRRVGSNNYAKIKNTSCKTEPAAKSPQAKTKIYNRSAITDNHSQRCMRFCFNRPRSTQ